MKINISQWLAFNLESNIINNKEDLGSTALPVNNVFNKHFIDANFEGTLPHFALTYTETFTDLILMKFSRIA